jgi:membrane-bound ClpP family serine protease
VAEEDLLDGMLELAELEGCVACPEGGATLAALRQLLASGEVSREDRVVIYNTEADPVSRGVASALARARRRRMVRSARMLMRSRSRCSAARSRSRPHRGERRGRVLVSRLDGPVSPVTAQALATRSRAPSRERYEALVVEVDTPGVSRPACATW